MGSRQRQSGSRLARLSTVAWSELSSPQAKAAQEQMAGVRAAQMLQQQLRRGPHILRTLMARPSLMLKKVTLSLDLHRMAY